MPIYEYACEKCLAKEEVLQKMGDPIPETCPHCRAKGTLRKVVAQSAFHLKGGGWYKDLYSSTKKSDPTSSPKTTSSDAEKDSSASKPKKGDE